MLWDRMMYWVQSRVNITMGRIETIWYCSLYQYTTVMLIRIRVFFLGSESGHSISTSLCCSYQCFRAGGTFPSVFLEFGSGSIFFLLNFEPGSGWTRNDLVFSTPYRCCGDGAKKRIRIHINVGFGSLPKRVKLLFLSILLYASTRSDQRHY